MSDHFAKLVSEEIARSSGSERALVVLPHDRSEDPFDHFSGLRANFLAHLIATRERLPQTLSLRRASPEAAISVYGTNACSRAQKHPLRMV